MNPLKIVPIPALSDNYIWLIHYQNQAIIIDPAQAQPVLDYVRQHGLTPTHIWITHHHADHIGGVAEIKQYYPQCKVFGAENIVLADEIVGENSVIAVQNIRATVWHTAGHTEQHLCYLLHDGAQNHLFCGDTLFSAGCGRVFPPSRPEYLYQSLHRINQLDPQTLLYPAHEYTASNLRFAAHIEPDNADIVAAQAKAACTPTLPVRLADEQRINPFLRVALPAVQQRVAALSERELASDEAVFVALRELKNHFA